MKKQAYFLLLLILIGAMCVSVHAQEKEMSIDSTLNSIEKGSALNAQVDVPAGSSVREKQITETVAVLDVKAEPLEDVLDIITRETGIVFILPEPVKGTVSLFMESVNVWDLLKIILQAQDLAYHQTDSAVHIMSKNVFEQRYGHEFPSTLPARIVPVRYVSMGPLMTSLKAAKGAEGKIWEDAKNRQIIIMDTPEKIKELQALISAQDILLTTREYDLQYISYEAIRDGLNGLLTKGVGRIEYRASDKKIIVTDAEAKLDAVKAFLDNQDKKVVMPFRIKIMRVALSEEYAQGVDWEAIVSDYQVGMLQPGDPESSAQEKVHIGTVTKEDYEILIDALDTVGELTDLIAFDFELALSQDESLDLDTNDPFWSLRPGVKKDQEGSVILDPKGFEMRINFLVNPKGEKMHMEMLNRLHWMSDELLENAKRAIFISKEKIQLDFYPKDVVVIGGLIRTEEIVRTRKFPFLSDLPVVGSAFRLEKSRYANTEYVIFLIPDEK